MDAKVMKEMLEESTSQVTVVEVGDIKQTERKEISINTPVKMLVVSGSLSSSLSNGYATTTLIKTSYFYVQNANRMYIIVTDSKITLQGLNNWYDVQVLLFH